MTIEREKLILVENFDELMPGVRVRVDCPCGAGPHDGMITGGPRVASGVLLDGHRGFWRLVPISPRPPCSPPSKHGHAIADVQVEMKMVRRWIDFDPTSAAEVAARVQQTPLGAEVGRIIRESEKTR